MMEWLLSASEGFWSCVGTSRESRVFFFDGNVGVGKTECMLRVAEMIREKGLSVACVTEDTERWVTEGLLRCKYEGDDFNFNINGLLLDYLRRHTKMQELKGSFDVILVERHPSTSVKVFGLDASSKALFDQMSSVVPDFIRPCPANTVYVKNSPRACMDRVKRRGRKEEKSIEDFTVESWHALHEDMMREREAMGGKVYVFDAFGADAHSLSPAIVTALQFK